MFKDRGKFTSLTQETKPLRYDGDKDILEDDKEWLHQKYYWGEKKKNVNNQPDNFHAGITSKRDRRIALRKSLQIKL